MISFKRPEDRQASALIVLSIVTLAGALLYMLFVPVPNVAGMARGRQISRRKIESDISATEIKAKQAEKAIGPRLWQGDIKTITAQVLNQVTRRASAQGVSLVAVRPQRTQELGGISELPFSVHLSGAFPKVNAVIATFDARGSKIVLRSVQLASSDGASSIVTAVLGISVFVKSAAPVETKPTTGGNRG